MPNCLFVIDSDVLNPIRIEYSPYGEYQLTKQQLKIIHYISNLAYKMFEDPFIQNFKEKYDICDINMMSFLIFTIFYIKYDNTFEPPRIMYHIWTKIKNERYYKFFFKYFLGSYIRVLNPIKSDCHVENVKKFFIKYKEITGNNFIYKTR